MSLNWNLTEIKDHERVCFVIADSDDAAHGVKAGDRLLSNVTHALIWRTMAVGIGSLTDKTAAEFATRNTIWCQLNGFANDLTIEQIHAHIGLRTNVSYETKAKWLKWTVDRAYTYGMGVNNHAIKALNEG